MPVPGNTASVSRLRASSSAALSVPLFTEGPRGLPPPKPDSVTLVGELSVQSERPPSLDVEHVLGEESRIA